MRPEPHCPGEWKSGGWGREWSSEHKWIHEIISDPNKCRAEDKTGSCGPESLVRGQGRELGLEMLGCSYGRAGTSGCWVGMVRSRLPSFPHGIPLSLRRRTGFQGHPAASWGGVAMAVSFMSRFCLVPEWSLSLHTRLAGNSLVSVFLLQVRLSGELG